MDDATLLNKFTANRCDDAFAELVKRYVDLVWSAARRQTNDADLAEDVTQGVFVTLAQKAGSIRAGEAIGGWLLVTTRYSALNSIRAKARRTHHEREAAAMNRHESSAKNNDPAWNSVSPLLDEAVARLKREDRDALALRFFEGRSMADVGAAMGISTEAAQKRVTRAVQRLREVFAARGLVTTEDALGSLLTANAVSCAPAILKSAIAAHALTSTAATTSSLATSKGLVALMAAANTKVIAVSVAAVLILGVTGTVAYQTFGTPGGRARQIKVDPAAQTAASISQLGAPKTTPPLAESQWLPKFTAAYALAPKQDVKFVPHPFVPERIDFYRKESGESQYQNIPNGPDIMLVEYDGKTFNQNGETFGGTPTVLEGASYVLQIKEWDLHGPDRLLHFKMPGDWVVRKGLSVDQRLPGFLTEVSKAYHQIVTMQVQQVPRQAVIIRGKLVMHPLAPPTNNGEQPVFFYRGQLNAPRTNYVGGTIAERISELCDMPVVDEAHVRDENIEVHMASNIWTTVMSTNPKHQQFTEELLANLAKQTSLDFKLETRTLPLWTISAGAPAGLPTSAP